MLKIKGFSESNFELIEQKQAQWFEEMDRKGRDEKLSVEIYEIKTGQSSVIDDRNGRIYTNYSVFIYYYIIYTLNLDNEDTISKGYSESKL